MSYLSPSDVAQRTDAVVFTDRYATADEALPAALNALEQREQETLGRWQNANDEAVE